MSHFLSETKINSIDSEEPRIYKASTREVKTEIPVKSIATLVLIAAIMGPGIYGCAGGGSTASQSGPNPTPNPTPVITMISPMCAPSGGAALTLTVSGMNFVSASVVNFGGTSRTTTFVSSTQLTAVIPVAAISSGGITPVTVTNPAPGGGTSNAVNFSITSGSNPMPTVTGLLPNGVKFGGPSFGLNAFGSDFAACSVVRWNGSDRPTIVTSTELTAQIPASDIAATGTAMITVFNPAPGGGISNSATFTITPGGAGPFAVAVAPDSSGKFGKFVYVANASSNDVSMYTIDGATGELASKGTVAGIGPRAVAADPSGRFVYVANPSGNVSMYTINTDGTLTFKGTIAAVTPVSIAIDPSGKFVFVANDTVIGEAGSVSMYTISADGSLASIGTVAAGFGTRSVAVAPDLSRKFGKFVYVTSVVSGVSMYNINADGTLTSIGTTAVDLPTFVVVHPSGKFAYAASSGLGKVSMFTIQGDGTLTSMGAVAAGSLPESVAIDPSGKFAYVANFNSNNVSMYTIDAETGALTSKGTIAAGLSPISIAVDPSGKFAYVANFDSHNISMYRIDPDTGALTLIGTIGA